MVNVIHRRMATLAAFSALTGGGIALTRTAWHDWGRMHLSGPVAADEVVALLATGCAAAVALWLALGMVVSAAVLLAGCRLPLFVPATLHRGVALALGVSLAAVALPAAAHPVPTQPTVVSSSATSVSVDSPLGTDSTWTVAGAASAQSALSEHTPIDPGWTPTPPTAPARTMALPPDPLLVSTPRAVDAVEQLAVRRGDTLWDLAARHLGADATDAEIATEWPRWHEANRDTIGSDPDLLLPGQLLLPPH